jgi:hypothetical protein
MSAAALCSKKVAWVSGGASGLMAGRSKPLNAIASVNAEYLSGDSGGLL